MSVSINGTTGLITAGASSSGGGGVATNTALGGDALVANTTGASNTAIGNEALKANTTASFNTAVGYQSLYANTTGAENTSMGYNSLDANTTGANNAAFGLGALGANTTANNNAAFGYAALASNTTGANNVAVGHTALTANTTASNNTAVGYQAGYSNTTGTPNTFVGYQAGYANTTGVGNTVIGFQAFDAATTGNANTIVGNRTGGAITTGANNVIIGADAGAALTTGVSNCFIGATGARASGEVMTTGSKNTILGSYDGNFGGLDIRTSSNYIVLSDGDGNPRQIITNNGSMQFGTTTSIGADITGAGMWYSATQGFLYIGSVDGNPVLALNRNTNDGTIVEFKQATIIEGTITVSGTTVSYNGGHLSRWSQFQNGGNPQVYRGTVLESTNDMCVWEKDGQALPNEQSTKSIISTTAKSKAVAGVFDMYDLDDKDNPYDFFLAQSGDFVIRIAQGVVVENGDLLESAGDGTARPQTDDICRSSTIAKVTSNYVSATYADGSYCVPCILMIG
jgi:hypothetical protein